MFYLLRKMVVIGCIGMFVGAGAFAYQKRHLLTPALDFYEAFHLSHENPTKGRQSLSGEVTKITGEYSFQMKNDQGLVFNFQLSGFEPLIPRPGIDETEAETKDESRTRLSQLILSNHVRVEATFLNGQRSGLGMVYLGNSNINAAIVEAGLARLNREYLKGLSREDLYALFRAERKAKEQSRGMWNSKIE